MDGLGLVSPLHQGLPDGDGRDDVAARYRLPRSWPRSDPPRRPVTAGLAMLASIPAPNMAMTSEDPPNETNGRGTPVTGRRPTTAPMLMTAWPTSQAVTPAATRAAYRRRRPAGDPGTDQRQGQKQAGEDQPADEARSPHR